MVLVIVVELGRRVVVALAPELDLLLAMKLSGGGLVKALERSVMALVDLPALVDVASILQAHLLQNQISRLDRPVKHARVCNIEVVTLVLELTAGFACLLPSEIVQRHVDPPSELAGLVPDRFAMPHEDHLDRLGLLLLRVIIDTPQVDLV